MCTNQLNVLEVLISNRAAYCYTELAISVPMLAVIISCNCACTLRDGQAELA